MVIFDDHDGLTYLKFNWIRPRNVHFIIFSLTRLAMENKSETPFVTYNKYRCSLIKYQCESNGIFPDIVSILDMQVLHKYAFVAFIHLVCLRATRSVQALELLKGSWVWINYICFVVQANAMENFVSTNVVFVKFKFRKFYLCF